MLAFEKYITVFPRPLVRLLRNIRINLADGYTIDGRTPERAIAFSEPRIQGLLGETGLTLSSPVYYGSWSGRPAALESQDVVIVKKE